MEIYPNEKQDSGVAVEVEGGTSQSRGLASKFTSALFSVDLLP